MINFSNHYTKEEICKIKGTMKVDKTVSIEFNEQEQIVSTKVFSTDPLPVKLQFMVYDCSAL